MGSMFPPGKEPLPFETASDRFAAALEQFGQPKATIEIQADHVMTPTEAEALTGPPNYPTFAVRALPKPKPVEAPAANCVGDDRRQTCGPPTRLTDRHTAAVPDRREGSHRPDGMAPG